MSTMDMAHWESRRNNEFVESVTYVAYEHIRHNTLFNIIYIMRTVVCGVGGLWWSDLKPGSTLDHRLQLVQASLGDDFSACLNAGL